MDVIFVPGCEFGQLVGVVEGNDEGEVSGDIGVVGDDVA